MEGNSNTQTFCAPEKSDNCLLCTLTASLSPSLSMTKKCVAILTFVDSSLNEISFVAADISSSNNWRGATDIMFDNLKDGVIDLSECISNAFNSLQFASKKHKRSPYTFITTVAFIIL